MADEIKLKAPTIEQQVVVNINGEDKLKSFADTLDKISNNKNLQKYWKTQQDLINATADAYGNFQKKASKDNASELIKVTNALKAMSGTDLSHILPDFDKISKSMAEAQKVVGDIDSAFSVKGFKEAFDSFETLKAYGTDIQKLFSHFGVSSDIGELQQNVRLLEGEVEKLTRRLSNARNANEELRNEFENFKVGSGFADKLDELDRLKLDMQNIRNEAIQTFNQFLDANKIDRYDWFSDDRFAEYFEKLENGTLTATDAIRRFKSEYSYLLEESYKSSGDSFGLDQLQAFSTKLDSIFHQVEETSNKINDIISNGVIAKSVQNLSEDTTLSDSQRSIFGNILQDEESLKSITALFQKLIDETTQTKNTEIFNTEQFAKIESLFTSIESSLSSIKGILVDVGDGEELSPLLREINNIQTAIGGLSSSLNNLHFNMNIDIGTDNQMDAKIQEKAAKALNAYEKLFNGLKMSGYGGEVVNNKFFDFDINKFDTTIGKVKAYKDIIERLRKEAKEYYGGTDLLRTQTDDKLWRSASSAGGQLTQAINETVKNKTDNSLTELFGKTDLSGVIEQLNTIVSKLDEISVSAKGFTETFKNGLNVNASVEEIEKLTNRVKELESELAKIKTPTATIPSEDMKNAFPKTSDTASVEKIADGFKDIKQETEKATESAKEYQRVLSQVGELGVDAKVSAMYQRNDGQLESVSWKAKRDDQGQILYDKNGNIDYDFNSTVISKYEQLEKIITTADNKLRDLQKSLKDTQNLNPNASTKNIEEQIQYQKDYIQLLEQTVKAISQQDEYLLYEQQIIDARAKAKKEYDLNQGTKSDISSAKQLASEEQKRQKAIEQTNRLLNRQQIAIDGIEKSYNKNINPDLDKSVSDISDLSDLAKKKSEIQNLINQLQGQDRNSSNEQEFLQLEKLISEYKQLAKDKLKANNPSKQELGGQDLRVLLEQQVSQYNQLISKAEKYGDATSDIVEKLKAQRDLIAQANSDGIYTAKSGLKADDYYSARDNYKIGKAQFSSYETDIKNTEKLIQAQKELGEATTKARQSAKDATQSSVDNALKDQVAAWKNIQSIREKIAKTKDTNEIANLQQVKKEYQQNYIEADRILKSNSSLYDKEIQLAKLEQIRVETNKKIADYQDKQIAGYDNRLESYTKKTSGYNATIARFNDGGWTSDIYLKNVQAVKDAVKQYEDLLSDIKAKGGIASEDDIQKLKEYESEIKNTIATVTNMSAAEKGYNFVSGQKELDKIHKLLNENSKMSSEAKAKIRAYYAEIESGNPSMSLDKIHGEILKIYNAEVEAGRAGRTLWDTLKNSGFHQIAAQMAGMIGVYDVINIFRDGINTLKEFDDSLTKISYTMDMTKSQLDNLGNSVLDMASDMKSSIDDAMQVAQIYANMQTSAEEIQKLSEPTLILSNLSGFDASTVADDIQAASQQFDIAAEDSMHIADVYDYISRNIQVDYSKGLESMAEGLQVAGSTAKQAGLDLEQTTAIIAKAVEKTRLEGSQVGNGLKTILTRLSKVGELSDEVDNETLSKASESLHQIGIEVYNVDGSYRQFDVIMGELAEKWDGLTDAEKSNLSYNIAATRQTNLLSAILSNFSDSMQLAEEATNANGSAIENQQKYMESFSGHLQSLETEAKIAWLNILDSETLKDGVDLLTGLVKVVGQLVDTFGLLGTAAGIGGIVAGFKNVGIDTLVAY